MSGSRVGARQRLDVLKRSRLSQMPGSYAKNTLRRAAKSSNAADHTLVPMGDSARVSLMLSPKRHGSLKQELSELLARQRAILEQQAEPSIITSQTIFLRQISARAQCEDLLKAYYEGQRPVTTFVFQPPCCGAQVALEAWAVAGSSTGFERLGPEVAAISYDSVRWIYCGGIRPARSAAGGGVYSQARSALERLSEVLRQAGAGVQDVVRTWFYLGQITEPEGEHQPYKELNRARSDFYRNIRFFGSPLRNGCAPAIYPASSGIGMLGRGLVLSCAAFQSRRKDAFLLPLENPRQTPAYLYPPRYSPKSPKFSRAVALVTDDYVITWISGTASVVNSESQHPGDIEKQTEQAIANIQQLIAPDNFAVHGVARAGAGLGDLVKLRVYLKRPADFDKCQAICQRQFGLVPSIYAVADVCRPELLVEIEGVAFSRRRQGKQPVQLEPNGQTAKVRK